MHWTLCILVLTLPLAVWCYGTCPSGCQCSVTRPLTVFCRGTSLKSTTEKIPPETVKYQYEAYETEVNLGGANFSHLASLKSLHLSSPYEHTTTQQSITHITQDQQRIFWSLANLTELQINIEWGLETALPELFKASENLESLDLSNTRKLNYTNLKETLVGLENSTVFKSLNIHRSQMIQFLTNGFTLNLTDLLDPLKNCPLEELDFSYNAIRTVVPGLISKAPTLKKLYVSNNLILPLLTGPFFFEVAIHPTLIEADFSEQGLGVQIVSDLTSDREYLTGFLSHPLHLANKDCVSQVLQDLCNIFQPKCADFLQQCTDDHEYFCSVFALINPLTSFIPCEFFPGVRSLLNPECGECFVFPLTGNLQSMHLQKINNYDEVFAYPRFRNTTCFNPNNSLKVLDFSPNLSVRSTFQKGLQVLGEMKRTLKLDMLQRTMKHV